MESYSNNNASNSYISFEDKAYIFSNLHMPTTWDAECNTFQTRRKYLSLPDIVNFSRIIQKCRLIEYHSYKVRDDMNSNAKELLYKYGLFEVHFICQKLKLITSQDIKNLSDVKINSLDIPKSEHEKLVELRDALANKDTHKAFSIAQADKVIEYANARYQIEREFWHAREDKAIAFYASGRSYMY